MVYLGDVPEDVVLVAVSLNEREFVIRDKETTGFALTEVVHANKTRGYILKVPFDHPAVTQQVKYSRNRGSSTWKLQRA